MVGFRLASLEDLPRIVEIYNQTIASREVTADLEPISVEDRVSWFHAHNESRRPLWVIEDDSKIVGWVSLSDFYGRAAYGQTAEISIYIDEQTRGKGVGRKTLSFVESHLTTFSISTLVAFIFGHNQASLHLFELAGFKTWGHLPQVAELDGIKRDLVILGKSYS